MRTTTLESVPLGPFQLELLYTTSGGEAYWSVRLHQGGDPENHSLAGSYDTREEAESVFEALSALGQSQ